MSVTWTITEIVVIACGHPFHTSFFSSEHSNISSDDEDFTTIEPYLWEHLEKRFTVLNNKKGVERCVLPRYYGNEVSWCLVTLMEGLS